jgi:hypothetical protein
MPSRLCDENINPGAVRQGAEDSYVLGWPASGVIGSRGLLGQGDHSGSLGQVFEKCPGEHRDGVDQVLAVGLAG